MATKYKKNSTIPQGWYKGADEFDRKVNKGINKFEKGIKKELRKQAKVNKKDKENVKHMSFTSLILALVLFFIVWIFLASKIW